MTTAIVMHSTSDAWVCWHLNLRAPDNIAVELLAMKSQSERGAVRLTSAP